MANNPLLYNAVIAGATGGFNSRWLQSADSSTYTAIRTAIVQLAALIDGLIPTAVISAQQALLLQCITQSVMVRRYTLNATAMTAIAAAIIALYSSVAAELDPAGSVYPLPECDPGETLGLPNTAVAAGPAIAMTGNELGTNIRMAGSPIQTFSTAGPFTAHVLALNNATTNLQRSGSGDCQFAGFSSTIPKDGRIFWYKHAGGGGTRSSFINDAALPDAADGILTPDGAEFFCGSGTSIDSFQCAFIYSGTRWVLFPRGNGALLQATLVINVPAVLAGQVGYVDTSLVGSTFEGRLAANASISVSPQSDLVAAGAGGGFINSRVVAGNILRSAFLGPLAGGNANFTVTRIRG